MSRPRIQWQVLDSEDVEALWTPGWLPDSPTLRYSLADAIRIEGVRHAHSDCYAAAESAQIRDSYVGETDEGDYVETTPLGVHPETGDDVTSFNSATIAVLRKDP